MSPQRFVFCTLRDFKIDVGETLRIYGIVNALAAAGHEVVFLSNATRFGAFHPAVRQVPLRYPFRAKRRLQALVSTLPAKWAVSCFPGLFGALSRALKEAGAETQTIFFFDYLDNTLGYLLQQTGHIAGYVNDVHGIATVEFLSNKQQSRHLLSKTLAQLKYYGARQLDKKVFEAARGFLWGSSAMQAYFEERYAISHKPGLVLPYLLDAFSIDKEPDTPLRKRLATQLGLTEALFVFMFVGTYKATAGVEDLIAAFHRLYATEPRCRLVLIGNGARRARCEADAAGGPAAAAISFVDPVPYADLPAYYACSQVIVCPDRDNPFSQYVVHIKYLDALATGKLVINGAFKSVQEMNADSPLSLLFQPSGAEDLYRTLRAALENYPALEAQYSGAAQRVKAHFTYAACTEALAALNGRVQP